MASINLRRVTSTGMPIEGQPSDEGILMRCRFSIIRSMSSHRAVKSLATNVALIVFASLTLFVLNSNSNPHNESFTRNEDNKVLFLEANRKSRGPSYEYANFVEKSQDNETTTSGTDHGRQNLSSLDGGDHLEGSEGDEVDTEISASILKLTHVVGSLNSPRTDQGSNQHEKRGQNYSSSSSSGDTSKRSVTGKKQRLNFFKSQSKRIPSLTSLLPKAKRLDLLANSNSASNQRAPTKTPTNSDRRPLLDPFLASAGLSNAARHHHHHQHQTPIIPFNAQSHHLLFGPQSAVGPPAAAAAVAPPMAQHNFFDLARPPALLDMNLAAAQRDQQIQAQPPKMPQQSAPSFDQAAAQSMEHYQRIRLSSNPNELPMFFAASSNENEATKTGLRVNKMSSPTGTNINQAQQQQQSSQSQQSGVGSEAIQGTSSSLFGDRAKSLMSHMNLAGGSPLATKINSIRNERNSATSQAGLASMIKSAAEAWAASNSGADPAPTIIVEHDGPTITTLDFNNNLGLGQRGMGLNNPSEDEEVTTFYSDEAEETESEGSHEAKRIAKLRHSHPFDQHAHSQNIQSEIPHDYNAHNDFYNTGSGARRGNEFHPHEIGNEAVQDYMRYQKAIDNSHNYPDSINAIKEQNNHNHMSGSSNNKEQDFAAMLRAKLNANIQTNDPLDQLIKELQDLNRKKKGERKQGGKTSSNQDDYEDLLNGNNDDEEDEQLRVLKNKLLARLRNKHDRNGRKKESNSSPVQSSSFQTEAVKIPLHALLLAALDRRMSPSEPTQTVVKDALISDQRNREIVNEAQRDFSEVTSDLGSLMNSITSNNLYNLPLTRSTATSDSGINLTDGLIISPGDLNNQLKPAQVVVGQQSAENAAYTPANGPMGPDNQPYPIGLFQRPVVQKLIPNEANNPTVDNRGSSQENSTASNDNTQIEGRNSYSTTRMPQQSFRETYHRPRGSSKGRRDVAYDDNEGNFDVGRNVDDFVRDKNERSLAPSWARKRRKMVRNEGRGRRSGESVEFDDDDYEDSARSSRRKIGKRKHSSPRPESNSPELNEDRFFDKLHRDTLESTDIDKNTSGIDDAVEGTNDADSHRHRKRRPQNQPMRREADDSDGSNDEDDYKEGWPDENGDEVNERRRMANRAAESKRVESSSTWRPQMVDDEVRKIEESAKDRERDGGREGDADEENEPEEDRKDDGEGPSIRRHEEAAESRNTKTTAQPDSLIRVTIDAGNGGTQITQQYEEKPREDVRT